MLGHAAIHDRSSRATRKDHPMKSISASLLASMLLFATNAGAQEPQPAAKDATVFGYKLHYLEAGRGDPVILLHGSGGEGARWMPTIKGLSGSFRVITTSAPASEASAAVSSLQLSATTMTL